MIPEELQKPEYRFIKLKENSKIPLEKDWANTANYVYNDPSLTNHLENNGNYGVLLGKGNLLVLDIDDVKIKDKVLNLTNTFTVQTIGGGLHLYYYSRLKKNQVFNQGEVRAQNLQVVGAGCKARDEKKDHEGEYSIIRHVPIQKLSILETNQIIEQIYGTKESREQKTTIKEQDTSRSGIEYRQVLKLVSDGKTDDFIHNFMKTYEKWSESAQQYRDRTIRKAREYIKTNNSQHKNLFDLLTYVDGKTGKTKVNIPACIQHFLTNNTFVTIGEDKPKLYRYHKGMYLPDGQNYIGGELQRLLPNIIRTCHVVEIVQGIKRATQQPLNYFEEINPNLIGLINGVYDLENDELLPHSPEYRMLQIIPTQYNQESTCPNFETVVETLTENERVVLQKYVGFCLYRKYLFKKALILVGEPDTGKTTILNAIINMLGLENCSGESLQRLSKNQFSSEQLRGKLMNFYDDLPFEELRETGTFKVAVGGGYFHGEKKFGESQPFHNYAKLIYACNKILDVKPSDDEAYYSRWLILFCNKIVSGDEQDPFLTDKLRDERSGILNWAIQGFRDLMNDKHFSYERTPEENKLVMDRSSSTVAGFAQDCVEESIDAFMTKEELYSFYVQYVRIVGGQLVNNSKFSRSFQEKVNYAIFDVQKRFEGKKLKGWGNVLPKQSSGDGGDGKFLTIAIKNNEYRKKILEKYDSTKNSNITEKNPSPPSPSKTEKQEVFYLDSPYRY